MRHQSARSARRWTAPSRRIAAASIMAALFGCGEAPRDDGGTAIGALVPFTGSSAAGGANFERAMLLAIEFLNAHEAINGQRFRLVVRDSHSAIDRTRTALDAVLAADVVGLIGPDQVEHVQAVRDRLDGRKIAHLLPNSMTLADFATDRTGLLARPAPAAEFVGCAVANRVYGDLHDKLVVIHSQDPYRTAFASATVRAFESYRFASHVGTARAIALPAQAGQYLDTVSAAAALEPDTVVVAADAPVAAGLIRAWSTLTGRSVNWFFEPALRSEEFLRNVSPGSVSGAKGVSLALPDEAKDFVDVYRERWDGEEPLVESHMYFDAVVAVGLATIAAAREIGRPPTAEETSSHLMQIVRGPGKSVSWTELGHAAELIEEGQPIRYIGAAGRWILDRNGAADGTALLFGFWTIKDGEITPENFGACPAGTVSIPAQ